MEIKKAFVFARNITPNEPPVPPLDAGVYFENGRFNPLYVPQGFDFNNNKLVLVTDSQTRESYWNLGGRFNNGEWADHFDDGTTFILKTPNAGNRDWKIENGKLVYDIDSANSLVINSLILPVVNMSGLYSYVNIHIRLSVSNPPVPIPQLPSNYYGSSTYERYGNTLEYATSDEFPNPLNEWTNDSMGIGWYTEKKIDFMEFDIYNYDVVGMQYKVEIDKIWMTDD